MWGTEHKERDREFLPLSTKVLNKVIHRAVESYEISKIIHGLAAIVMFHFNFVLPRLTARWKRCGAMDRERCGN
jgi:hypothetical protein